MVEYIEREAARQAHIKASLTTRLIDAIPAADVAEVVRCKDCIYHSGALPGQPNIICFQMKDNDFCSYGARMNKEDAEGGRG